MDDCRPQIYFSFIFTLHGTQVLLSSTVCLCIQYCESKFWLLDWKKFFSVKFDLHFVLLFEISFRPVLVVFEALYPGPAHFYLFENNERISSSLSQLHQFGPDCSSQQSVFVYVYHIFLCCLFVNFVFVGILMNFLFLTFVGYTAILVVFGIWNYESYVWITFLVFDFWHLSAIQLF